MSGGIFYMLSGAFSWYLPNPNPFVMAFTPFILYSLERIFQSKDLKNIPIASVAFCLSILGSHIESLVLQFTLVGMYFSYRFLYPILFGYKSANASRDNASLSSRGSKRVLSWTALSFIGGIGLSAFSIFPVYEFLLNNHLEHGTETGLMHANLLSLPSIFIPYVLGQLHAYWALDVQGISLWGYVGIFALFFSILYILLMRKNVKNNLHKYTPVFFLSVSVFFLLKVYGSPLVNWLGYLPIFDLLSFSNYAGVIIPFGFAIAGAFGIDLLFKIESRTKISLLAFVVSVSIIFLFLIPVFSYLSSSDVKLPQYVTFNDAKNYVTFQVVQAILFVLMALFISITVTKNKSAIIGLIPLILLELSVYLPVGLHPLWQAYKSIIVISTMTAIMLLIVKPNGISWNLGDIKKIKSHVIIIVLVLGFCGEVLVSDFSPFGMMYRYDSYQQDPVTNFLKENLHDARMFSFDYTLGPNYPAAYKISTLGQFVAFNTNSFYSFIHNFLDKNADAGRLGFPAWTYTYGPMDSINKFFENKKYFDFLGVKYIITEGYDFNTFAPGIPGLSGENVKIESHDNSTGQTFLSPTNKITAIGVSLGTLSSNAGNVTLTVNSVPYDGKYHRESTIKTIMNQQLNEFEISPTLADVANKKLYFSLKYTQVKADNFAIVFTYDKNQSGFSYIKDKLQGEFYENGIPVGNKEMAFSIESDLNKYSTVFKFNNINIFENKDAFPRTFLVSNINYVEKDQAQDFLLKHPSFDLRHGVVLEQPISSEFTNSLQHVTADDNSSANIVSYTSNKVLIKTNNKFPSVLVITDLYYPGWKSYVDGKESTIYRADGLVRAVFVPEGDHTVEFSYMPKSFVVGVVISFTTGALLLGLFMYSKRKKIFSSADDKYIQEKVMV